MKASFLHLLLSAALLAVPASARDFSLTRLTTNGTARNPCVSASGFVAWQQFSEDAYDSISSPSDIVVWKDGAARNITAEDSRISGRARRPAVGGDSLVFLAPAPPEPGGRALTLSIPEKTQPMLDLEQEYPALFEVPESANDAALSPDAPKANAPAAPEPAADGDSNGNDATKARQNAQATANGKQDDVYWYNAASGVTERVTPGTLEFLSPVVCESGIATLAARRWPYGYEMITWKPGSETLAQITTNYYYVLNPCASGHELVFQAWDGYDYEIYHFDFETSELKQITQNTFDDLNPVVADGQIAWVACPTVETEIFFYRDSSILKISSQSTANEFPSIWNGRVVWQGVDEDGDLEIYYFDGRRTVKLTSNAWDDIAPKIADGVIAWSAYVNNWDAEAMALDLSDNLAVQLTDNDYEDIAVQTAGEKVVWQTVTPEGTFIQLASPDAPRAEPVE